MLKLTGPEILPQNITDEKILIVIFHGYGQTGSEILQTLEVDLHSAFPHAYLFAPNAPSSAFENDGGLDWLSYEGEWVDERILKELYNREKVYNQSIDAKLRELNIHDNKLILIGFSQGARLILHLGFKRKKPCAGILCFSGKMTLPYEALTNAACSPKVCLINGDNDKVIQLDEQDITAKAIVDSGGDVEIHRVAGLDHAINKEAIALGLKFIKSCFQANEGL
jgi:phospholipase/carboxylesterase